MIFEAKGPKSSLEELVDFIGVAQLAKADHMLFMGSEEFPDENEVCLDGVLEVDAIAELCCFLRWSKITSKLSGRTNNEIKIHWNTHIKKKLLKMGIDPVTYEPHNKQAASQDSSSSTGEHLPLAGNNHVVKEIDEALNSVQFKLIPS